MISVLTGLVDKAFNAAQSNLEYQRSKESASTAYRRNVANQHMVQQMNSIPYSNASQPSRSNRKKRIINMIRIRTFRTRESHHPFHPVWRNQNRHDPAKKQNQ